MTVDSHGGSMKNYDSKINPFVGAAILGFTVPVAVYAILYITFLVSLLAGSVVFLFFAGKVDWNAFLKLRR